MNYYEIYNGLKYYYDYILIPFSLKYRLLNWLSPTPTILKAKIKNNDIIYWFENFYDYSLKYDWLYNKNKLFQIILVFLLKII